MLCKDVPSLLLLSAYTFIVCCGQNNIWLKELGVQYVPYQYSPERYDYDKGAAEQGAVDPTNSYYYAVGLNLIHVIDFSDPSNPSIVHHVQINHTGEITDIETCGNLLAVSFDAKDSQTPLEGRVIIFEVYRPGEEMVHLEDLVVGAVPDMLYFTHDCQRILVAIEGELKTLPDGSVVDPEGGVVIITNLDTSPSVKMLNFTQFNAEADKHVSEGVRWIYRGEGAGINTTFSQDLEPEYIAIDDDDVTAYINLQENNAIITLDLQTETITGLYPLYKKSWSTGCSMDASNRDNGINMNNWDIYGISQADAIKYFKNSDGKEYIITANEGDPKEYENPDYPFEWGEAKRGQDFIKNDEVSSSVSEDMIRNLNNTALLGRLEFSSVDGMDDTGKFFEFVSYGTRSFSMYEITDSGLTMKYDSCDDFEKKISEKYPDVFNSNSKDGDETPFESFDSRSDDQGPSPESLAVGDFNGKPLIFIGLERPGLVAVYPIEGDQHEFESINYFGRYNESRTKTFKQMYLDRETHSNDPEDLTFIAASRSPNGKPMLVVCGSVSGTAAFLELTDAKDNEDGDNTNDDSSATDHKLHTNLLIVAFFLFYLTTTAFR